MLGILVFAFRMDPVHLIMVYGHKEDDRTVEENTEVNEMRQGKREIWGEWMKNRQSNMPDLDEHIIPTPIIY